MLRFKKSIGEWMANPSRYSVLSPPPNKWIELMHNLTTYQPCKCCYYSKELNCWHEQRQMVDFGGSWTNDMQFKMKKTFRRHSTSNCRVARDHTHVYDATCKVAVEGHFYHFRYQLLNNQGITHDSRLNKDKPTRAGFEPKVSGMNSWFDVGKRISHHKDECWKLTLAPKTVVSRLG